MLIAPQNSRFELDLSANLQAVRGRIAASAAAAGRSADSITLVGVTKGHAAEVIRAAAELGLADFGESYLQEAIPKRASLQDLRATWHFIGRIQTNKTRLIAANFDWAHGVDRLRIAERLSAQRAYYAQPLNVCVQVNIAADPGKAGLSAAEAQDLVQAARELPALRLRGLMCMLPVGSGESIQRQHFAALRQLRASINRSGAQLDTLSMGMSEDYPAAIREGATLVRVGTAIFGPRAGP